MTIHKATDVKVFIGSHLINGFVVPGYFMDELPKVSDAIQHQRKKEEEYAKKKLKEKPQKIKTDKTTTHTDISDNVLRNLTKVRQL